MQGFEGLGTFYLGARYDLERRERTGELVLYDSKDLVTHAVIVGMTGSGKTGLGTVLLEEAALDGIPALVIDPKGDLGNLMLTFPELRAGDFAPWIDPGEARDRGTSVEAQAEATATKWRRGLAEWGQDGARIGRLAAAAEFALYTPGSSAGRPLSVLESFAAPGPETLADAEALGERVATLVASLLALVAIDADPVRSREHVLLSALVHRAWAAGRALELAALVAEVREPSLDRIGVLELETFFPAKERFELALALNQLLASPSFAAWMQGEPLDVDRLLHTAEGRPRVAIVSIAHLDDPQRMFFVALLLEQVLAWVRRQRGTSSLRAVIYMDEVAGYVPPVANPPSKKPLLTLMKQARAFGVGVVLATQNPVDLDYKGLGNAGTWFIGRLQTERDKQRLLDGLEGASAAGFDRAHVERALSQLPARVFWMNDVHEDGPQVLETRWAMSYLRGPMTRAEIRDLTATRAPAPEPARAPAPTAAPERAAAPAAGSATASAAARPAAGRPVLPPDVPQYCLPIRGERAGIEYRPGVLAIARVRFTSEQGDVDEVRTQSLLATCGSGPIVLDWDAAQVLAIEESDLEREPAGGASFATVPPECTKARSYAAWQKSLADHLQQTARLELLESPRFRLRAAAGESEREFRLRVAQVARERRELAVAELRARYAPKLATLEERQRRRAQAVAVQAEQARGSKLSTVISFGAALLSAFLGKRVTSAGNVGRAATAARGVGRTMKESSDVERARADVAAVEQDLTELQQQLATELAALTAEHDASSESLVPRVLRPRGKPEIRALVLAWIPHRDGAPVVQTRVPPREPSAGGA